MLMSVSVRPAGIVGATVRTRDGHRPPNGLTPVVIACPPPDVVDTLRNCAPAIRVRCPLSVRGSHWRMVNVRPGATVAMPPKGQLWVVEARSTKCGAVPPISQAPRAEPQGLGTAAPPSVSGAREWLLSATSTGSNSLRKYGPGGTRTDIVIPPARTTAATGGP